MKKVNITTRKFPLCGKFVLAATIKSEEIQETGKIHPWAGDNTWSKWECGYITISLKLLLSLGVCELHWNEYVVTL